MLVYEGGKAKTFTSDCDELCYFDLVRLGKQCGEYEDIKGVYFLIPGLSLLNGLRMLCGDNEVVEFSRLATKYRCVDLYVCHKGDSPLICPTESESVQTHFQPMSENIPKSPAKKLTPRRRPQKKEHAIPTRTSPRIKNQKNASIATLENTNLCEQPSILPLSKDTTNTDVDPVGPNFLDDYEWIYPRPDEPIPINELIGYVSDSSDESDLDYEPKDDHLTCEETSNAFVSEGDEDEIDDGVEQEIETQFLHEQQINDGNEGYDSENNDKEFWTARERVRICSSKLLEVAKQVQREAEEERVTSEQQ
ncbi:putative cytosol aminopeptidase [Bienertia sinuspersici]